MHGAAEFRIADLVAANAVLGKERLALLEGELAVRHGELPGRTARLANHLLERGVLPGDRVALLLYDGIAFIELLLASARIGATAVLLNWRLAAPEIAALIERTEPRVLFHSRSLAALVPAQVSGTIVEMDDTASRGDWHDRLATTGRSDLTSPGTLDAPFFLMFTSGTTGKPKGCMHSQDGAIRGATAYAMHRRLTPQDRLLSTNPLFHVAGLQLALASLVSGGSIRFVPRGTDAGALLALAREGTTHGMLNPNVAEALRLARADGGGVTLRTMATGAGSGTHLQLQRMKQDFGFEVIGGYGQTEVGGWAMGIDSEGMAERPTTLGWPLPLVRTAVLDEHGHPLEDPEAEGEMGLRAPSVMAGYWQDPASTQAAIGTGWLRTGDLVRRDSDGLLHLLGRSKELIKTGGENVYPAEVEAVFRNHPAIADLAVAGVSDRVWGEAVKLFVVLKPGTSFDPLEAVNLCRGRIAGYKRPRYFEIVDEIPRDPLGKILRRVLSARPVSAGQSLDQLTP